MTQHDQGPPRASFGVGQDRVAGVCRARWPQMGVELVSTGGTAAALRGGGLAVKDVSELTGFPEMLDGRVKTLHPQDPRRPARRARERASTRRRRPRTASAPIDLLVVNLYPFEATVAKERSYDECVENIDIGGPALIRAAAKNHASVTVVVEPDDYARVLEEMKANDGATTLELRKQLAAKAFARTAAYDAAIGAWFAARARRGDAGVARVRRAARAGAALWREPASVGGVLRLRRGALRRGDRRPASGQGALLQQSQRYGRGLRACRGARRGARGRHHQAREPVRRCARRHVEESLSQGARTAIPSAPSAASSPSTALSTRRPPRRSPRSSPRW